MKCPKCKTENLPISDVCKNCGLKFKTKCPKCSTMNKVGSPHCSNCGLMLIRFCPKCNAANAPTAQACRKCGTRLLIKCQQCSTLNVVDSKTCTKCGKPFIEEKKDKKEYPILAIKLENFELLHEQVQNDYFFQKLIRRFYQTIIKTVNDDKFKILKVNSNLIALEFKDNDSEFEENAARSVYLGQSLLEAFRALNVLLDQKADINFDVKFLIFADEKISEDNMLNSMKNLSQDVLMTDRKIYESSCDFIEDFEFVFDGNEYFQANKLVQEEPVEELVTEEVVDVVEQENPNRQKYTRDNIARFLIDKISNAGNIRLISLQGPEGIGKSSVLNLVINSSVGEQNLIIYSECCDVFRMKPFGLFQDILRSLIGLPIFNLDKQQMSSQLDAIFESNFSSLSAGSKEVIKNFIVPSDSDFNDLNIKHENIYNKRDQLYMAIEEVFSLLKLALRPVIIIEDLEYIDDSSLELLEYLIDNGLLNQNAMMITTQSSNIPSEAIINSSKLTRENTVNLRFDLFNYEETIKCIDGFTSQRPLIPLSYKDLIYKKSKGLPLYVQNAMLFLLQKNIITVDNVGEYFLSPNLDSVELSDELEELIILRLDDLFKKTPSSYKTICYAVLSGYNFSLQLIQSALGFPLEDVKSILQVFINAHFLSTYDGNIYFFKNKVYFETIKKHLVKDEYEKEINFELFQAAKQLLSGDNFYCASLAVGANQNGEAYMLYGKATREALLVGDVNLYLKSQKSVLKLFDYSSFEDKDDRKKLLCEELGKANYISCPHDAIEFLTESLQLVSSSPETSGKDFKIMNLLGYLSKSFVLSGNFQGAIQAIDQSIGYLDTERMPLEYALLSSLKMKILLTLGQLGEVVSLAKNTIIPIYNDAIIRRSTISTMSIAELKQSKQKALIMLARAYAMQGSDEYVKVLESLDLDDAIMTQNNVEALVTSALYKCLQGDIASSNKALEEADAIAESINVSSDTSFLWSFIKLLNESFSGNFEDIEPKIIALSQNAKKANNSLIYNLSTLLIARFFREIKQYDKAKAIITDRIHYFSQQKMAIGALLCWYLIGCIYLEENDVEEAINIATQALDVAQKPGIHNIYFEIYFYKLLADCYIVKNDFEMVNINLEKAMNLAKKHNMFFLQCRIYILMAKAYHEITVVLDEDKPLNAQNSYDLYMIALNVANNINNEYLKKQINLDVATLKTYCNLQKIELKEKEEAAKE